MSDYVKNLGTKWNKMNLQKFVATVIPLIDYLFFFLKFCTSSVLTSL